MTDEEIEEEEVAEDMINSMNEDLDKALKPFNPDPIEDYDDPTEPI